MKKRIVSLLLALVMVLSLVPMSVFAADNHDGQVHVIVENTTYPEAEGAPWEGTLVEEWIDLNEDSTMMGCIVKALEKNGYKQTGAENNYISSIQGLGEFDGGSMSGWMGTLNDWFTNYGFGAFTVAGGTLGSGDEIRIMYTRNGYGADLGGSWDNHIKTVKALTFSAGELSPAFDPDTHEYTLTVDKGTDSVLVTPTASNKNYQVRTYVGETEYKRTAMVPTVDGTPITVKCGDPSWPNMNGDNEPAQVYTVNVKVKSGDKPVTPTNTKVLVRAQDGGAWLHQPMVRELTGGEAEKYGYTDKVEGVSALDALVVSHELTFGDDFTPETAKNFLEVGSSGFITKLYGTETSVCGFYVNAGYPNDGTKAPSGPGYNGTTVVNTKLKDGDVVDFFFYADGDAYSDYYTWIDVPETMVTGEAITVTVKGFYAVEGYRYKDAAELKAAARPLEGVGLAWVDADGYIKPIKDVVTDKDGQATFTVGSEATGYLVAQSGDGVYALMNPSDYIRKVAGKPVETLGLTIRSQADNAYLQSISEVQVASNTAEKYGFTDKVEGVSVLDALVAAHVMVYGDKFTPATAKQYLAINPNNDWESKVFGRETGFHGFYINGDFPTNEAGATRPKVTDTKLLDGDVLDYFVGSDAENQNDYYTWLEVPATMTSGEDITVTVKGVKALDPDATQANAQPLEGVGLAWLDMTTGTIKPIDGVVTDENGKATFTVVEGVATGYLVATTATYHTHTTYALMNPSEQIKMVSGNVHTVELKGLHNAQLNSLKLYTYKNGVKGTQDLLSGISTVADGYRMKYTAKLASGTYWVEGYDANKDGDTVTVTYRVPETSLNHFVRVQNPDGVTYWDFNKWTTDQDIVVTRADLHMDDDFNKDTVSRFDKNTYDLGNVYLNINAKGYMNMNAGDTYELDVFRNWQAIEGFVNAKIALPDAHYEVVDFDGKPSDVVSIAPNADNSCLAYMTANHQGTALVKVTYDAMTHKQGQSSTADKTFSAIWPEFTGVFVVSVGADGTAIQTNMLMDRMDVAVTKDEQKQLDAEHDILFYLGTDGASYTFTPESGCTVTVARSTVGKTMTFNGFTSQGVTVDAETGAVTVANLTTGRHIVRVEKDGVATYQVITARGVSYKLLDAEGNELPENAEVKPGETVQLQFTGLVSPKEKMAGVYNHRFSLYYTDADGNSFKSNPGGYYGVYDFSGNPARQRISITVPADQEGLTYELTGAIKVGGYPGKPTHRIVTYAEGMGMQHGTATASVLAQLPQVTLKLSGYAADAVEKLIDAIGTVTLDSEETIKAARDAYDALTEEQKAQVGNYQTLLDAEAKLADLQAADAVEKLIDAIGTVTLDSEEAIKAARGAYDALTEEQKAQVGNYQTLLDAEAKLADLQAADAVEKLIDAIGTVTLDSEEAIKAARGAYDALTEEQKAQVGNYQTLLDAEAKLADLQAADAVEKLIDAIGTVTLDSEEAIKAARGAYDALTEEQKAQVGNYQTLLDAEAKLAQLKKDAEKPSQPEQPAKPSEDANKPATGDAGVALWLTVMCMTSLLGAALVGKKRKA